MSNLVAGNDREGVLMLTREEAIRKTREMWNWIASETEKQKRMVTKNDFFDEHFIIDVPYNGCYLCQYILELSEIRSDFSFMCRKHCPLDFCGLDIFFACERDGSPYLKWYEEDEIFAAAEYAKQIAELPERKVGAEVD